MKQIDIKTPCSENWNDFTPTKTGGFCSSCQKNVIDFSNKSNAEIQSILEQNKSEKVCGRFRTTQLDQFNNDYLFWKNYSKPALQSRFVMALVLVFGLSLFSCSREDQGHISQIEFAMGKIIQQSQNNQIPDIQTKTENITSQPIESGTEESKATRPQAPNASKDGEIVIDGYYMMGDIDVGYQPEERIDETMQQHVVLPENTDSTVQSQNCKKNVEITREGITKLGERISTHQYITGMVIHIEQPVTNIVEPLPESIEPEPTQNPVSETADIKTNLYPNPSNINSTLELDINKSTAYNINLLSNQGKIIQNLHEGLLPEGITRFNIDLEDLEHGMYLINIQSNEINKTLKLIKG